MLCNLPMWTVLMPLFLDQMLARVSSLGDLAVSDLLAVSASQRMLSKRCLPRCASSLINGNGLLQSDCMCSKGKAVQVQSLSWDMLALMAWALLSEHAHVASADHQILVTVGLPGVQCKLYQCI